MTATYYLLNNGTQYDITSYSLKKELSRSINACQVNIVKTDASYFSIGNEPQLMYWDGSTATELFHGRVSDKQENYECSIIIEGFGGIINKVMADEVYDNKSPEYIAADLIDKYTDLTYASTATSGITITKFVLNTVSVGDAMGQLLDLLSGWIIKSDNSKNFYFEPKTTTYSSETVTINDDSYLTSEWNRNPDKIVNQITLVGGLQSFSTTETFSATTAQTYFLLSYKPNGNLKITDNGTEVVGGVSGTTGTYDYVYDPNSSTPSVTFGVGRTVGHTILINYSYDVPVKVTAQNDASIALYGPRGTKITKDNILTMDDARKYCQTYLAVNSLEDLSAEFNVDIQRDINEGELLPVVDAFNNINQTLIVNNVTLKFPDGVRTVKVGRVPFDDLINQKEINDRLKKLEQSGDNTTLLQVYREIVEPLNVTFIETVTPYTIKVNDSFIWGVSKWGVDKWGDRKDGALMARNWTCSASTTATGVVLTMNATTATQTALYNDNTAIGYSIANGKINISFASATTAGTFDIRYRKQGVTATTYYLLRCNIAEGNVGFFKDLSGVESLIGATATKVWGVASNEINLRFGGTAMSIEDGTDFLIETTDSNISTAGNIELSNIGNTITVSKLKIYEGY